MALGLAQQHIGQVFVGQGMLGVGAQGQLKRALGQVDVVVGRLQHAQVVVRFGQLGEVLGQLGVDLHGLFPFALARQKHGLPKAHLRVARALGQMGLNLCQRGLNLVLAHQLLHLLVGVGDDGRPLRMRHARHRAHHHPEQAKGAQRRGPGQGFHGRNERLSAHNIGRYIY